jgi:hypothetical protein
MYVKYIKYASYRYYVAYVVYTEERNINHVSYVNTLNINSSTFQVYNYALHCVALRCVAVVFSKGTYYLLLLSKGKYYISFCIKENTTYGKLMYTRFCSIANIYIYIYIYSNTHKFNSHMFSNGFHWFLLIFIDCHWFSLVLIIQHT